MLIIIIIAPKCIGIGDDRLQKPLPLTTPYPNLSTYTLNITKLLCTIHTYFPRTVIVCRS